jgi:mannobiose 2-epimerase
MPRPFTMLSLLPDLRARATRELTGNILPFWARHAFDPATGNLIGRLAHDLRSFDDAPRHVVLCSRILWTFAAAQQVAPSPAWLAAGEKALALLDTSFTDPVHGGVYWSLHPDRSVASDRKQVYAQAFTIYGLAEWFSATGDTSALARAQAIFQLLETHARDRRLGGYIEALSRDWGALDDMRLSDKDLNSPKSMNTLLHVLEAYTKLLRVWPDPTLRSALQTLVTNLLDKVYTETPFPRFALFFDLEWRSLNDIISYGHDIETSWLLCEAADALGDPALTARVQTIALKMARAVLAHGVDADGSLFYDGTAAGVRNDEKHWWVQAEAVVGFFNAWQLTREEPFLDAALRTWTYIEQKVVDAKYGEWFAVLARDGTPRPDYPEFADSCKIGPWKCPYHNARSAIELMRRIP